MTKERITITIDRSVRANIIKISEEESRSISQMVNLILKEYIENKESE